MSKKNREAAAGQELPEQEDVKAETSQTPETEQAAPSSQPEPEAKKGKGRRNVR